MKIMKYFVLLLVVLSAGCSTTNSYWRDRGNDLADIASFGVGYGLGAKGRVGPVQTGLIADAPIAGLRGGKFFTNKDGFFMPTSMDIQAIFVGCESFDNCSSNRCKNFYAYTSANGVTTPFIHRVEEGNALPYYTEIEGAVGLGLSLRLGFNPGELVDFIAGFWGVDLYKDDIYESKKTDSN